jgi:hypothetical protein
VKRKDRSLLAKSSRKKGGTRCPRLNWGSKKIYIKMPDQDRSHKKMLVERLKK